MKRITDLIGTDVLDLDTAETIGKVDGLHIDSSGPRVAALRSGDDVIAWSDIESLGGDAITVRRQTPVDSLGADDPQPQLIGHRVLTDTGNELGEAVDAEIREDDGFLTRLVTGEHTLENPTLHAIGGYAAIVTDPFGAHDQH